MNYSSKQRSNFGFVIALSVIALLGLGALFAHASGTTITGTTVTEEESRTESVKAIAWAFTTDATGTAIFKTEFYYSGKILGIASVIGSASPSDGWDLAITDQKGVDVLAGYGMNQTAGASRYIYDSTLGVVANDRLTFNVTNAGASKNATATIWIR